MQRVFTNKYAYAGLFLVISLGFYLVVSFYDSNKSPDVLGATEEEEIAMLNERIAISQAKYYGANGIYWQGLKTHTAPPNSPDMKAPNNLAVKPFYQKKYWDELVTLPTNMRTQLEVHQYRAPNGDGYQIFFYKIQEGKLHRKSIGHGPESASRTHEWEEVKKQ